MNQLATSAPIVPATFGQRRVDLADGCFRDIGNALLAADGSRYFLEWTPVRPEGELRRIEYIKLAAECALDGGNWDLPTPEEQLTLIDRTQYSPATFSELREETPSDWFHTKTVDPSSPSGGAFYVYFASGYVNWLRQLNSGFARFVRRVPASQ